MCSAPIYMDNQVFIFGSFSECEATYFQFASESPINDRQQSGHSSRLSSPELVKTPREFEEAKKASSADLFVAAGNGNLKEQGIFDLDTSLTSLTIKDEASLVSCNGETKKSIKENEVTHIGNGVLKDKDEALQITTSELTDEMNGTEGIGLEYKDPHTDSNASTPREADAHAQILHERSDFNGDNSLSPVKPTGKTWASLLDDQANGNPQSRGKNSAETVNSKNAKRAQVTELSGDLWHQSLREVEAAGKRLQPRGLVNKGNLCFLNATLQALLSCSPFVHLLHTLQARGVPEVGYPTVRACVDFFKEFEFQQVGRGAKVATDVGRPFVPSMFDNILHQFNPHQPSTDAARNRQEDAQEFLSFTMDHLHDELIRLEGAKHTAVVSANHTSSGAIEDDDWETVGPKNRTAVVRTHTFNKSALSDIFGGELCSVVKTKGNKASATVQPFLLLHLDILPEAVRTVEDALKLFAAPETLEGYKAAAGKAAVVSASKSVKLQSLPQVLILHLKRFSYGMQGSSKLHKALHFPLNLSLGRDLLATTGGANFESRNYELVATVTHHGKDPSRGHYTAHSKQLDGQWLRFDDNVVSTVGTSRVLQDLVYLLFYKRSVYRQ